MENGCFHGFMNWAAPVFKTGLRSFQGILNLWTLEAKLQEKVSNFILLDGAKFFRNTEEADEKSKIIINSDNSYWFL